MQLEIQLDPVEARLFGVLVEKALTTPDQYPLSVHAATVGANQKSNRDPVLSLGEDDVEAGLQRLEKKYMARRVFPANSRIEKFCHNGKDALGVDAPGLAVLAELLMRGPQTPGELRSRANRMVAFESIDAVMGVIAALTDRGLVRRVAPAPGSRAERYVQLVSPDLHPLEVAAGGYAGVAVAPSADLEARVVALEHEVRRLRGQLSLLAERVGHPFDDEGED